MIQHLPAKRRRGGQPGNQNAKSNRGNSNPRRNVGNRGGKGAPLGNQYANKKKCTPDVILLRDYQHNLEAVEWIKANASKLRDAAFTEDDHRDRALYDCYRGLTLEAIAESGQEYRQGIFKALQEEAGEDGKLAA